MKLYLMRHGEASSTKRSEEQVLTSRGEAGITQLAEQLRLKNIHFEHAYYSGKVRAQQTAEIMLRILSPELDANLLINTKPGDDPGLLLPVINSWDKDALVVSHLPFIPKLVTLVTGSDSHFDAIDYVPGTFICLERDDSANWELSWASSPGL